MEFQGVFVTRRGPYLWNGLVRGVVKSDNELFTPASSLVAGLKENTGSGGVVRAGLDREVASSWRLGLVAEFDLLTRSESEGRNGSVAGIGPQFQFALGGHTSIEASGQYWRGSMDGLLAGTARRRVSGVGAGLTLRWSPR